jgi:hypothetical protein
VAILRQVAALRLTSIINPKRTFSAGSVRFELGPHPRARSQSIPIPTMGSSAAIAMQNTVQPRATVVLGNPRVLM